MSEPPAAAPATPPADALQPLPSFISRRPTNWWLIGGMVAAGLVTAFAIVSSRPRAGARAAAGPSGND